MNSKFDSQIIFTSGNNKSSVLCNLASIFYKEIIVYGNISDMDTRPGIDSYFERVRFILLFLKWLDEKSDLKYKKLDLPYIYWHKDHKESLPIVGYVNEELSPKPYEVFADIVNTWFVDTTSNVENIIRSVIYYTNKTDFNSAIKLIATFSENGIAKSSELCAALDFVLYSRSKCKSDKAFVNEMLNNAPIKHDDEWRKFEFDETLHKKLINFTFNALHKNKEVSSQPGDKDIQRISAVNDSYKAVLSALIKTSVELVNSTRNSNSWNSYLSNYAALYRFILYVNKFKSYSKNIGLGLRTVLSQLEEIKADYNNIYIQLNKGHGIYSKEILQGLLHMISFIHTTREDENIIERILEERIIVPKQLSKYINRTKVKTLQLYNYSQIPETWQYARWQMIHPISCIVNKSFKDLLSTSENEKKDEFLLREHIRIATLTDEKKYDESVKLSQKTLQSFPWAAKIWCELAIALDKKGKHNRAVEMIIPAITLQPQNPLFWKSLSVILKNMKCLVDAKLAHELSSMVNLM